MSDSLATIEAIANRIKTDMKRFERQVEEVKGADDADKSEVRAASAHFPECSSSRLHSACARCFCLWHRCAYECSRVRVLLLSPVVRGSEGLREAAEESYLVVQARDRVNGRRVPAAQVQKGTSWML